MSSISNSLVLTKNLPLHSSPDEYFLGVAPTKLSFRKEISTSRRSLSVRSAYRDGGRLSSESVFVGGFILGGLIVGACGCVFAPQISKALAGAKGATADRKDLLRKLPKFIYDEEKALEKTRKKLTEKIAQLNSALDDFSAPFHTEDATNGMAVNSDEMEAAI